MKVYVASSWRNLYQPTVVESLRAAGHEVYDFRNPAPGKHGFSWREVAPTPPPWSAEVTRATLAHPRAEEGFALDIGVMTDCDAVVMVQPSGRSAALELGWCAGAGKLAIVLLVDDQEPELMLKVADFLCTSLDEVHEALNLHVDVDAAMEAEDRAQRLMAMLPDSPAIADGQRTWVVESGACEGEE